jgi:mitogen-activated protein kinase kinase kinase
MTANGSYHPFGDAADSPASPTSPISSVAGQHHKSLSAAGAAIRGQSSPFPTTPTSGIFSVSLDPPSGVSYAEHIRGWSDAHVGRWLTEIKCANQITVFKANDIRGDIILELDQTTLQEMGVSSIGDRLRILNGVKSLRQKAVGRPMSSISSAGSHRSSKLSVELTPTELASNLASKPAEPVPAVAPRVANRRLESGRPTPLQLNSNSGRSDLPRLVRDAQPPDSARSGISMASTSSNQTQHSVRPLPQPAQVSAAPSSSSTSAGTPSTTYSVSSALSTGSRVNLPPLPPPPRGQPPLPPAARPPVRGASSATASMTGRRTPTQNDSSASSGLLTPGSGSTWYGLPSDPRPGNPGGGKSLQSGGRSTSPLPPVRPRNPPTNPVHARNASLGVTSPSPGTSPGKSQRPVITGHPYANQNSLRPPGGGIVDLSPIQEHFGQSNGSSPSPPSYAARTLQSNAPSLDDLRRKLVRFYLPEEGQRFTIDVDTCAGGVEIIEKVLRKFGKGGPRSADTESEVKLDDEGLSVDGWSVYMDDAPGTSYWLCFRAFWLISLKMTLWMRLDFCQFAMPLWTILPENGHLSCGEPTDHHPLLIHNSSTLHPVASGPNVRARSVY